MSPKKRSLLPLINPYEDLETISKRNFETLLDITKFEPRQVTARDKGVDYTIELKENGVYTNYYFAVQLKSTEKAKKNDDGYITYLLAIYNINYLFNLSTPAYYCLYDHKSNTFYYEDSREVYRQAITKPHRGNLPKKISIKFIKPLTTEALGSIYEHALKVGALMRNIRSQLQSSEETLTKGILIDDENEVYSVEQNIAFMHAYGHQLFTTGQFKQIIEIEKRTHPRTNTPARFAGVAAMAYFHQAKPYKAIELLQEGEQDISALPGEVQMIKYSLLSIKYSLGILSKSDFDAGISQILAGPQISSFLQLQTAYRTVIKSDNVTADMIKAYYNSVANIITSEPDNQILRTVAYAQILEIETTQLLKDFASNFLVVCILAQNPTHTKLYKEWTTKSEAHTSRIRQLMRSVIDKNNYIGMSQLAHEKCKWDYAQVFIAHLFSNWDRKTFTVNGALETSTKAKLEKLIKRVDAAAAAHKRIGHMEQFVESLILLAELYDLSGDSTNVTETHKIISETIKQYDIYGMQVHYERLVVGATRFRNFLNHLTDRATYAYKLLQEDIDQYLTEGLSDSYIKKEFETEIRWTVQDPIPFSGI